MRRQGTRRGGTFVTQDTGCGAAWWTLQTAPHSEVHVCKHLAALGLEWYAPEFAQSRNTRAGSIRDRRRNLVFPGYVFFRSTVDPAAWVTVRWVPGVVRVLEQDCAPAMLGDSVIRELRQRIADRTLHPPGRRWRAGEGVVIVRGPLAPLDAIFDQELDAAARVQILVRLMGRELPVCIDPTDLRAKVS
jgi:transcription termination/antitermination protein NusG